MKWRITKHMDSNEVFVEKEQRYSKDFQLFQIEEERSRNRNWFSMMYHSRMKSMLWNSSMTGMRNVTIWIENKWFDRCFVCLYSRRERWIQWWWKEESNDEGRKTIERKLYLIFQSICLRILIKVKIDIQVRSRRRFSFKIVIRIRDFMSMNSWVRVQSYLSFVSSSINNQLDFFLFIEKKNLPYVLSATLTIEISRLSLAKEIVM